MVIAFRNNLAGAVFAMCDQGYSNEEIREIVESCLSQRDLSDDDEDEVDDSPVIDISTLPYDWHTQLINRGGHAAHQTGN